MTSPDPKNAREALLHVAKSLFTSKAYAAVSTRELAETAGVNLGAIQYHFGSKAKLFLEAVYKLMEGNSFRFVLESDEIRSSKDANQKLCEFILSFLDYLLHCKDPHPCRLMFREVFSFTAEDRELRESLLSSVVNDFIRPVDQALISILKVIRPQAPNSELELIAQSVIGQCAFYMTHGPFMEHLRQKDHVSSPRLPEIATHIMSFTLRGLEVTPVATTAAIEKAFSAFESKAPNFCTESKHV